MLNQKLKPILKFFEWLIFSALIFVVFIILSPLFHLRGLPSTFIVATGSMEPLIKIGSIALTQEIDPKSVKVGDIIAFTSPSDPKQTILHRVNSISSVDPLTFKTKGDNNKSIDNWDVRDSGIKGKFSFAIPYLGHAGAFIRKPLGFSIVIGIPAVLFILLQLLIIKKAIAEEVDRKVAKALGSHTLPVIIAFFISLLALSRVPLALAYFSDTATISGLSLSVANFSSDDDDDDDKHCPPANDKGNTNDKGNGHDNNCDGEKDTGNNKDKDKENDNDDEKEDEEVSNSHHPKLETHLDSERHYFSFSLTDVEDFYEISYRVNYDTENSSREFEGREDMDRELEYRKLDILLGSKSAGGGAVFDEGVKNIKISIRLTRPDGTFFDLEDNME